MPAEAEEEAKLEEAQETGQVLKKLLLVDSNNKVPHQQHQASTGSYISFGKEQEQ